MEQVQVRNFIGNVWIERHFLNKNGPLTARDVLRTEDRQLLMHYHLEGIEYELEQVSDAEAKLYAYFTAKK